MGDEYSAEEEGDYSNDENYEGEADTENYEDDDGNDPLKTGSSSNAGSELTDTYTFTAKKTDDQVVEDVYEVEETEENEKELRNNDNESENENDDAAAKGENDQEENDDSYAENDGDNEHENDENENENEDSKSSESNNDGDEEGDVNQDDYDLEFDGENNFRKLKSREKELNATEGHYKISGLSSSTSSTPTRFSNNSNATSTQSNDPKARLVELMSMAQTEHKKLAVQHQSFQQRLAEYFRDQKIEDTRERDKGIASQELRFQKILAQVQEWRHELQSVQSYYNHTIQDMKARLDEKVEKGLEVQQSFLQFKREIAKDAENSRTGKKIPEKALEHLETEERVKDEELEKVRLKNIQLRNQLQTLEKTLQEKEKLKDGLHLIDFEQLKIENQTFNEKIEERNDELLKLRKKINNTVQILTHLKEKLQFVAGENHGLKTTLSDLEKELASKRDALARDKQLRDSTRQENVVLKRESGLVASNDLLYDYAECLKQVSDIQEKQKKLQERYKYLTEKYPRETTPKKTNSMFPPIS